MTENKTFPQLSCDAAKRTYLWEARCVHPKFPSPLSLAASRVVIRDECRELGYPPAIVRTIFMKGKDYAPINGAVTPKGRIYLRQWNNKAVVLHELAHYFLWVDGVHDVAHGDAWMRHYRRLLERTGTRDLEVGIRAYGLPLGLPNQDIVDLPPDFMLR